MRPLALALFLVAGAAGLARAETAPVAVEHAWARPTPPHATNAAVYFTVKNTGKTDDILTGAETPAAAKAELHESSMEGGIMKMRSLVEVVVPAGESVAFAPSGKHLMLLGVKAPLTAGQSFTLSLKFKIAGTRTVQVDVADDAPMGDMDSMHMHH